MKNLILITIIFLNLISCAGIINVKTKESVIEKSTITIDSFKKTYWLKAPKMRSNLIIEGTKKDKAEWQVDMYFLRAMKEGKNTNIDIIQIYVSHDGTDWYFFNHAVDDSGREMEFIEISKNTSSATRYGVGIIEDFAITVSEDYLNSKVNDGIAIKIYGEQGNRMLKIPSFYIQGFLEKLSSLK